ncbi:type I-E CRISPR-associated protein Cse2/CasB [Gordonia sp. TBRC 11910]|uniref:Type I-E CRISPR-associated protein Cse2/CasB n=1 Tax=Gordonia asplenii TaxID=2725283 RepID=A0A848L8Y0_9ACTN|nr:type I-E CRISPR-associated protein Cse2/CasB [Gordonia asplenii]NMO04931.1 type I-E CRISPR-associated protein Cse2/CasB [Gordonia asplenii]
MTTSTPEPAPPDAPSQTELAAHVAKLAGRLQHGAITNLAGPVADLARLRRSLDAAAGSDPVVWRIIFAGFPEQPDEPLPSRGEYAAYLSVCLFAIHQQSKNTQMHGGGRTHCLGRAIRQLAQSGTDAEPDGAIVKRFNAVVTADDFNEVIHHLRSLVGLLRVSSIPLDYGLLADDLYQWQLSSKRSGVRLRWSRDFSRVPRVPKTGLNTDSPDPDSTND